MKNILQTSIKSLNTAALAAVVFASLTSNAVSQPISPADQAYFEGAADWMPVMAVPGMIGPTAGAPPPPPLGGGGGAPPPPPLGGP